MAYPISTHLHGPTVIGGVGGSGTRLIAEMLILFGYYLGNDLNEPKDFLLYTLLFKRKKWYYKNKDQVRLLNRGFRVLEKSVVIRNPLTISEVLFLANALISMSMHGHNHLGDGNGTWPLIRVKHMLSQYLPLLNQYIGWGWKEPNSHLLIGEMNCFFDAFKYIHVIRHGLDMAYSNNQQQLYNWGPLFGVDPHKFETLPMASFDYWTKANRAAIEKGKIIGSDKFFLLNYDLLCSDPEPLIRELLAFLKIEVSDNIFQQALHLPRISVTTGRFRNYNTDKFDEADLTFLQSLGFTL